MTSWNQALPYFPEHELECPHCNLIQLDIRFAAALPALRLAIGHALYPTSVTRCPAHNRKVRGHPRSMHLTENPVHPTNGSMGADIAWRGWPLHDKLDFARLAWSLGWSVGLHDGFCHVDRRADLGLDHLPQKVYLYDEWGGGFDAADVTHPEG